MLRPFCHLCDAKQLVRFHNKLRISQNFNCLIIHFLSIYLQNMFSSTLLDPLLGFTSCPGVVFTMATHILQHQKSNQPENCALKCYIV